MIFIDSKHVFFKALVRGYCIVPINKAPEKKKTAVVTTFGPFSLTTCLIELKCEAATFQ